MLKNPYGSRDSPHLFDLVRLVMPSALPPTAWTRKTSTPSIPNLTNDSPLLTALVTGISKTPKKTKESRWAFTHLLLSVRQIGISYFKPHSLYSSSMHGDLYSMYPSISFGNNSAAFSFIKLYFLTASGLLRRKSLNVI